MTAPAPQAEAAPDAVRWLRDNYDAYPNIATLCDAMQHALATPQASQPAAGDGRLLALADRVSDLLTAWSDTDERDKRDAIANEIRALATPPTPAGAVRVDDAMVERYCAAVADHLGNLTEAQWAADRKDHVTSLHRVARIGLTAALAQPAAPSDQEAGK